MDTEKIIKEEIVKAFRKEASEEEIALLILMNKDLMDACINACNDIPDSLDEDLFRAIVQCSLQLSKHGKTLQIV